MERILYVERCSFGSPRIEKKHREYRILGLDSPVGTVDEIRQMIADHNLKFTKIHIDDGDEEWEEDV